MLLSEYIFDGIRSLRATRTRTLLTTLGVAIGVGSVTAVLALGGGLTGVIRRQIGELGGNIAVIRPGGGEFEPSLANPLAQQNFSASSLTEDDLTAVASIRGVEAAAPIMALTGNLKTGTGESLPRTVVATTPELAGLAQLETRDGQFIDTKTDRTTAVIGSQLSVDLFGTEQSIGRNFSLRGQTFTVIGVLRPVRAPINFNNIDFDRTAIVNLETGKDFHRGVAQIQQINLKARTASDLPALVREADARLRKNRGGERDYSIILGEKIAEPTNRLFILITAVVTAIAAISLIVGGIGIMNIMLVGVAERTREIGIRKAVGASGGDICRQFMTESLIISLLGGVLGYLGGNVLALMASRLIGFSPAFTWPIALAALGLAMVVGLVFGLYPALRAARKDPIESLRHFS